MQLGDVEKSSSSRQEFLMTDRDFNIISDLAKEHTGIVIGDHKKDMIYGRVSRRLRKLGFNKFSDYINYINKNFDDEISYFINAITTNLTSFFRENHHFKFLENTVFPELIKNNHSSRRVRIWAAGCSTGQEPYSIAMVERVRSFPESWDFKVLATDLDSDVLTKAKTGSYSKSDIDSVDNKFKNDNFFVSDISDKISVKDDIKKNIYFKRLNLLGEWPMSGLFDAIFCRNVVIYFDKGTQRNLFNRYADYLKVGGYLFIGHSENLNGLTDRFENIGNTIYRKIK